MDAGGAGGKDALIIIVRQSEGHECGANADRTFLEAAGHGRYRLVDPGGVFMEVPAGKVEHVRLSEAKLAGKSASESVRGPSRKTVAFLSGMRGRSR